MKLFTKKKKTSTDPHYGDAIRWIERAIDSCETVEHTKSAGRLIHLFEDQYYEELTFGELRSISRSLLVRNLEKWGDLVKKVSKKK
jgi:hypothetical protein